MMGACMATPPPPPPPPPFPRPPPPSPPPPPLPDPLACLTSHHSITQRDVGSYLFDWETFSPAHPHTALHFPAWSTL